MITIYQVDSFTRVPFRGNPAAVCLLDHVSDESWMQSIAAEINLSETAFLTQTDPHRYRLRWFTPTVEVDLCGHATLASAHILREIYQDTGPISFDTLSGTLVASFDDSMIQLNFPRTDPVPSKIPDLIIDALQIQPLYTGKTIHDFLIQVADADQVRACQPNFSLLKQTGVRGVMITAESDHPDYDFVSRFFVPGAGIDEDPVTGSAHCALIPFWSTKFAKNRLVGFQASRRGGVVVGELQPDRVNLFGEAVTVFKSEFLG